LIAPEIIDSMDDTAEPVRVDRWLWAARLVKTRPLAAEAVKGGRVQVNGQRTAPGKRIKVGDRVEMTVGELRRCVLVRGTSARRGPASVAELLYEETPESVEARERHVAERRQSRQPDVDHGGRPTKRDRRRFEAAARRRKHV
jgi:ribosome-associated heat shock protein Hsp15